MSVSKLFSLSTVVMCVGVVFLGFAVSSYLSIGSVTMAGDISGDTWETTVTLVDAVVPAVMSAFMFFVSILALED